MNSLNACGNHKLILKECPNFLGERPNNLYAWNFEYIIQKNLCSDTLGKITTGSFHLLMFCLSWGEIIDQLCYSVSIINALYFQLHGTFT
jgi:hypothetical protein